MFSNIWSVTVAFGVWFQAKRHHLLLSYLTYVSSRLLSASCMQTYAVQVVLEERVGQ